MKKTGLRVWICLLAAVVLCLAACGKTETDSASSESTEELPANSEETISTDVAEGVSALEELEQRDPVEVETYINAQRTQEEEQVLAEQTAQNQEQTAENTDGSEENELYHLSEDEIRELNFIEIFSGCIVMGDSLTEGLLTYGYLNSSEVIYKSGISIPSTDDHLAQAQAMNPSVVFLSYGSNDISHIHYDYDRFREEFEEFIDRAQTALPNAEIYVNLIFPATEPLTSKQPWYTETAQYNAVIMEVCEEHGIPYIDSTDLVSEEYFAADGYHFYGSFYPLWLYNMAKEAHLL